MQLWPGYIRHHIRVYTFAYPSLPSPFAAHLANPLHQSVVWAEAVAGTANASAAATSTGTRARESARRENTPAR